MRANPRDLGRVRVSMHDARGGDEACLDAAQIACAHGLPEPGGGAMRGTLAEYKPWKRSGYDPAKAYRPHETSGNPAKSMPHRLRTLHGHAVFGKRAPSPYKARAWAITSDLPVRRAENAQRRPALRMRATMRSASPRSGNTTRMSELRSPR